MRTSVDGESIVRWIERAADVIEEKKTYLTELDGPIGDSDHGVNMARGFSAARAKLAGLSAAERADVGALFKTVGMTLLSTVGGASGPLYGTFFLDAAKACAGAAELDGMALGKAFRAGLLGVVRRGKAEPLDKTMLDALGPALDALDSSVNSNAPLGDALRLAAEGAQRGAEATVPLVARKGRASYLGERSVGHQDPGATSSALILRCLAEVVAT